MDQLPNGPRACRCCLSTNGEALRPVKSPFHILDLLVGKELALADLWLCYHCSHTVRKICLFRDLCSRAYAVLQEYSTKQDSNEAKNYFRGEKEIFNQGRELEPSMSNTLCMNIILESLNSPFLIDSFNRNGKPPKNYTEDITRYHEIVTEGSVKVEKEFYCDPFENVVHSESYPEMLWSNNVYDVKFEDPDRSPESDVIFETIEFPIKPLNRIEDIKNKVEARFSNSLANFPDQSSPKSESIQSSSVTPPGTFKKKSPPIKKELSQMKKASEKKKKWGKTPKSTAAEVEKVSSVRLTLEEQMKDKEDRAKEESYLCAAFKCELCVVTFQSRLAMVNHKKKHLESRGPLICPVCSLRFPKFENLSKHRENHSIRFICHICEKRYYNRKTFISHLIWHSGEFKCSACGETFTDNKKMREHVKKEHPTKGFECSTCGKNISSKPLLQIHMQRHRGIPTHVCSICSKGFYSEKNLYLHLETHNANNPLHYCVECDRHFKTLNILKKHLAYAMPHCDASMLKYKCEECPKAFQSVGFLARHKDARHGGVHKYVCDECGVSYADRCGLLKHIKYVHQGHQRLKRFPCTLCEKAFISRALLLDHTRVHTGERPFKCPHCPDTFKQKSTMGTHIKLVHLKLKRHINSKRKGND